MNQNQNILKHIHRYQQYTYGVKGVDVWNIKLV